MRSVGSALVSFLAVLAVAVVVSVAVEPLLGTRSSEGGKLGEALTRCEAFVRNSVRASSFSAMGGKSSTPLPQQSVHEFKVKDNTGEYVSLSDYKGKVLLIVNVASQCGLTNSNYKELTEVYNKYKDQGLEILAFPCNQFGGQEPGSNEDIKNFACTRFKAEFPIFSKIDVNGENADPLYAYLKSSSPGFLGDGIKWNFSKFLVDKEGKVVNRYAPTTSPSKIEKDIRKLL